MKTPADGMRYSADGTPGALHAWWPWMVALSCFLLARPYEGFVHDARLYVGFAVAPLDPGGIGTDLLFVTDEQSGRSLYPVILRALSRVAGPSMAALLVTAASLLLWFTGAWRFVRRIAPEASPIAAAAMLIVGTSIHTYYGGSSTFHFAEPFAAPRVLAEALVLWGLASAMGGRRLPATVLMLTALAVHPLMGVAGAGVCVWIWLPSNRVRVSLAIIASVAALVLLSASAVSAAGVLRVFDGQWLGVLDVMGALVFLKNWEPLDWARIVVHAATLLMAATVLPHSARRVVGAACVVAGMGMVFAWLGADLAHNLLFTQAQLWRSLWLIAVLAGLSLGWLFYSTQHEWRGAYTDALGYRVTAVSVLLASWFMLATSTSAATLSLLAMLLWYVPTVRPGMALPRPLASAARLVLPVLLLLMVAVEARVVWDVYAASPGQRLLWYWPTAVLSGAVRLLGYGAASLCVWMEVQGGEMAARGRRFAIPAAVALLLVSLALFDSRSGFERSLEAALDARVRGVPATPALPAGPMLWPDGEMETWAFFGRSGYGNIIQGTPRVFSRELALKWAERRRMLTAMQSVARAPRYRLRLDRIDADDPTGATMLCRNPDAPATVALWRRPAWAAGAIRYDLPEPQLLPGQDPGESWEVRRTMFIMSCKDILRLPSR